MDNFRNTLTANCKGIFEAAAEIFTLCIIIQLMIYKCGSPIRRKCGPGPGPYFFHLSLFSDALLWVSC